MASLRPKTVDFDKKSKELLGSAKKLLDPSVGVCTKREFQYMFQDVYALCTAVPEPFSDQLYTRLSDFLQDHVALVCESVGADANLLRSYRDAFAQFYAGSESVDCAFKYLNEEITKSNKQAYRCLGDDASESPIQVRALALLVWKKSVFEPLCTRIISDVLAELEKDRKEETADLFVVKGVLESLLKMSELEPAGQRLDTYINCFEDGMLAATREHYERESQLFLESHDCSSYMVMAERQLEEEEMRARRGLQKESHAKVLKVCEEQLVDRRKDTMSVECKTFIDHQQLADLKRMYGLLKRIDQGLDPMLDCFGKHVHECGLVKLRELATTGAITPTVYMESLMEIHRHYDLLVKNAFAGDPAFVECLDKACRSVVNHRMKDSNMPSAAELLAKYADSILKKSSKSGSDAEVEQKISDMVVIFKYVNDKDIFQKFYHKSFAKRLIHDSSVSEDAEEAMIRQLTQLCGYEFTSKFHRMFQDVSISTDMNGKFQDTDRAKTVDFSYKILILQAGAWPLGVSPSPDFHIPLELERCIECFEKFYQSQHLGRKLNWMHHLSTADVKARLKSRFEFVVTTYQMAILLLFNAAESYPLAEIQRQVNLSDRELQRTVRSLVTCKVLLCPGFVKGATLENESVISLNVKYSNKKRKLRLSAAVQRETPQESQVTRRAVDDDRRLFLQAVTVRIMKMRKTQTFSLLIQEVIDQSARRFQPSVPQIKKCIEELIEKSYLERKEGDKHTLYYVA